MPERFLVSAVGSVIEVDVSHRGSAFAERAFAAWADALCHDRPADQTVRDRPELDDDAALAMLSTDVTLQALAHRRSDGLWMLHAAGLADEQGRVIVLSAASGTGKTTAARHLSQRYAYVSDETVAIDADGVVLPYRKPLSVIRPGMTHKVQTAPSMLGGRMPLPTALHAARIVVLDRRPDGPSVPAIEELDIVEALEMLAPQSSYLGDTPAPLHLIASILDRTGGAVRLRYREVETIDDAVAALLRTPVGGGRSAAGRTPRTHPTTPATGAGYRRIPVVDALTLDDGRLAVLRRSPDGTAVHVLDGIGPAVWHAADGRTIDAIRHAVIAAHGTPEGVDPVQAVAAAVARLRDEGLLEAAQDAPGI